MYLTFVLSSIHFFLFIYLYFNVKGLNVVERGTGVGRGNEDVSCLYDTGLNVPAL